MLRLRADALTWQAVDDELVVLDLTTSRYLSLNASGATLWQRLVEGADVDDLVDHLVEVFDIDRGTAAVDVAAFVAELDERGLLAPGPG